MGLAIDGNQVHGLANSGTAFVNLTTDSSGNIDVDGKTYVDSNTVLPDVCGKTFNNQNYLNLTGNVARYYRFYIDPDSNEQASQTDLLGIMQTLAQNEYLIVAVAKWVDDIYFGICGSSSSNEGEYYYGDIFWIKYDDNAKVCIS